MSVNAIANSTTKATAMIDNGCCTYCLVNKRFVRKANLLRIPIPLIQVKGINNQISTVSEITEFTLDVGGVQQHKVAAYITQSTYNYDMILGKTWLEDVGGVIDTENKSLWMRRYRVSVRSSEVHTPLECYPVSAAAFQHHVRESRKECSGLQIFAASMQDIQKALQPKTHKTREEVQAALPAYLQPYVDLFVPTEGNKLPPHRGPKVDHTIELNQVDGQTPEVPYGPLYAMSRDELLVLRRTLLDLLDKGFIRASNSPAASPVLFVRKPGGGLRFCVDYRALNALTKKDRYPLPLIKETLSIIGRATWYTKLDVTAAFHKIRIAKGQEWMTAFRTRFGSYEWLVTPFGLANAPSTFQRYINWALRDFLDDFASAYLDDVLIFTEGSLHKHHKHVRQVIQRLEEAGLHLELSKCEFDVQRTKYLGFILEAGKGISMDPDKIQAIRDWQPPTTVKGVRGFLGFANFYRKFIKDFATLSEPLVRLTKKDTPFQWKEEQETAFQRLKESFFSDAILTTLDPERKAVIECDSSGFAIGATLSQEDNSGNLRTVAYLSRKFTPYEANYPIHDKELLAVIYCLQEWDSELRSVREFEVITDHKNLEYFTKKQKLTERHVRWAQIMSQFGHMKIRYRPGKENVRADALSRRDQDMPQGEHDERLASREFVMLVPSQQQDPVYAAPVRTPSLTPEGSILPSTLPQPPSLENLIATHWDQAVEEDQTYQAVRQAVKDGLRSINSVTKKIAVSLGDCTVTDNNKLQWRNRTWVPESEPLRTGIIQQAHLAVQTGHPGREETYRTISRMWYWPGMSEDNRRFVRNCEVCRQSTPWRDGKHGYLRPLPVPGRTWQHLTVDFITGLPLSSGCIHLMVVKDRLSKAVTLIPLEKIEADDVAWAFVREVYRLHGLPQSITSDRGTQFISELWGKVCKLLGVQRNLSTAFHPQTDGLTERANSDIEVVIRTYVNHAQDNWATLTPILELMLNTRTNSTTGVSPFFLQHGFENSPFPPNLPENLSESDPLDRTTNATERAEAIVRILQQAADWAVSAMTYAQQQQEAQANRTRQPAPKYQVGDWVWLNLKNVQTSRTSKKLDWKNAKFQVSRVRDPYWVELEVPWQTKSYYVDLLRPAANDLLPSQQTRDSQPGAIVVREDNGEEYLEYKVEDIVDERVRKGQTQY
jgi:transposase InsO family protein